MVQHFQMYASQFLTESVRLALTYKLKRNKLAVFLRGVSFILFGKFTCQSETRKLAVEFWSVIPEKQLKGHNYNYNYNNYKSLHKISSHYNQLKLV